VTVATRSRLRKLLAKTRGTFRGLYGALYGLVLHSFKSINRKVRRKFPVWRMKQETSEHVRYSVEVFLWLILPLGLAYFLGCQLVFGENVWGPMLWGLGVYFYSSFLPDLPSIYRQKKLEPRSNDLPWYKKYALLLLAPLLVWLLFSGVRLSWRTIETYHNFRSLAIYSTFLFVVGYLGFAGLPLSMRDLIKVLFFQFCGMIGFLAHLKVDEIW
jgi:hypothetical protein